MRVRIKRFLNQLGIYNVTRKLIVKVYYPYKNYKINKHVKKILLKIIPILEQNTQDYWLDYGTLLGCVREGKIIKHDIDMDFGVIAKAGSLKDVMQRAGFVLTSRTLVEDVITLEQYEIYGIGFDIFYYRIENNHLITNIWFPTDCSMPQFEAYKKGLGSLYETSFNYTKTKEVSFYDVICRVPENTASYLTEHFGSDYMTPNPNWHYDDEKNKVKITKQFIVDYFI